MATTNINVRVDENLKKNADKLFSDLGMNMSTAINIFLTQAVETDSIPFPIRRYNAETIKAMAEIEEMKKNPDNYKSYSTAEEMTEDILNEVSD